MGEIGVLLDAPRLNFRTWAVLSGLWALQDQRRIRLRYRTGTRQQHPGVITGTVNGTRVAFDITDFPDLHAEADVVFKRSHDGRAYPGDVRPMGLVAGWRDSRRWPAYLLRTRSWRALRAVPPPVDAYRGRQPRRVLFQVKAWQPHTPEDGRAELNEQRARVIRLLRAHVGPAFTGGFVPSPYARRVFPGLLATAGTRPRAYARLVSQTLIGVSTVGLHGSNPWKLAQYLAAGAAIVTEPLSGRLPEPLREGRHLITAASPEYTVTAVRQLLDEPDRLRKMRCEASSYFERHVRPDRMVLACLEQVA